MRSRRWGPIFLVILAGGCQQPPRPAPPPDQAAARCGGMDSPGGFQYVVAGTDNQFFTARTRQTIRIKPNLEVKAKTDEKGNVLSITMARDNKDVNVSCACPAGCKSDPGPGHGCVIEFPPGGSEASCSGDCVTDTGCCFGCGFMAPR
jgi:hypothetical protein